MNTKLWLYENRIFSDAQNFLIGARAPRWKLDWVDELSILGCDFCERCCILYTYVKLKVSPPPKFETPKVIGNAGFFITYVRNCVEQFETCDDCRWGPIISSIYLLSLASTGY